MWERGVIVDGLFWQVCDRTTNWLNARPSLVYQKRWSGNEVQVLFWTQICTRTIFFMRGGGSCSFVGHIFWFECFSWRSWGSQGFSHDSVCNTAFLLKVGLKRDLGPRGSFQESFPQIVSSFIRRWRSSLLEEWKTFWENTFRGAAWWPWWRSGRHQARGRNCQWNLESFAEKPSISKKAWIPCTAVIFWSFHTDPLIRTIKRIGDSLSLDLLLWN